MTGTDIGRIGRCCVQVFLMMLLIGWTGGVCADDVIVELEDGADAFTVEQPAGTERLRVGAGGVEIGVDVGIGAGAAPPQDPLHVDGNIRGNFVADDGTDCPDGNVLQKVGGVWECASVAGTGDITGVHAGTGLTGGGTGGDVTLNVDTGALQSRVTGTCPPGQQIGVINADGTVICEPDDDTTYTAGTGLNLTTNEFSVTGAPWGGLTGVPAGFADNTDNDTTYSAGSGLDLTGTMFSVTGAPWGGLTGVPAGFADGTDDGIAYSAGNGLTLATNEFSVNFGGNGSATTASRSDHTHASASLALAAVKELYQMVKERDAQIDELTTLMTQQQYEIVQLKDLVTRAIGANPLYARHQE